MSIRRPKKQRKMVTISARNLYDWAQLSTTLYNVMADVIDEAPSVKLTITSLGRTPKEDEDLGASGIHSAGWAREQRDEYAGWRAVDIIWQGMTQEQASSHADRVNAKWTYDPNRPRLKVVYSKPHGTGIHAHIQVHPNTIRKTSG